VRCREFFNHECTRINANEISPLHRYCRAERRRQNDLRARVPGKDAGVIHFVNVDLITAGLSPLRPELAALAAGRLLLAELDRLAKARTDFAFETTLGGLVYLSRLKRWKAADYRIEIIFLRLPSTQLALRRIAARVKQGGHSVPRADVLRRFERGWQNFIRHYARLRMFGRFTTIPAANPGSWRPAHEKNECKKGIQSLCCERWPRVAPRRAGRAQDRPRSRHTHLRLAGWQSGGAEAMKPGALEALCSLDFHFKDVKNRFKKLGL
jgi:predicted ABC-type ATPase